MGNKNTLEEKPHTTPLIREWYPTFEYNIEMSGFLPGVSLNNELDPGHTLYYHEYKHSTLNILNIIIASDKKPKYNLQLTFDKTNANISELKLEINGKPYEIFLKSKFVFLDGWMFSLVSPEINNFKLDLTIESIETGKKRALEYRTAHKTAEQQMNNPSNEK